LGKPGIHPIEAAAFVAIMFFAGVRLIPWLLEPNRSHRSRELFILVIWRLPWNRDGRSENLRRSLALGAFMAGAIISQSHLSHQVGRMFSLSAKPFPFCSLFRLACW